MRDAIYAALLTVCIVFGAYGEAHPRQVSDQIPATSPAAHTPTAALLLVAVAGLVLAVRNRWPRLVLVVSAGAVAVYSLLGYVNGAAVLAPVVAVYTLATKETARRAIAWSTASPRGADGRHSRAQPVWADRRRLLPHPGADSGGVPGRHRRHRRREYVRRSRPTPTTKRSAGSTRNACGSRVTCTMSSRTRWRRSTCQAGTAAHVAAERPEVATQALLTIKAASKDGLRELRAILNVLRRADETDPTQPAPGIDQIGALVERARQVGLETTFSVGRPAAASCPPPSSWRPTGSCRSR